MSWQKSLRNDFSDLKGLAYFNVAFSNPMPKSVLHAVRGFLRETVYGTIKKDEWTLMADRVRQELSRLIGGEPRNVIFTKNTTEGINIVAQGLPWQPGDNIVCNDQEHPANLYPWLNLKRRGVEVRIVKAEEFRLPVDLVWSEVDEQTRVVTISHVQYNSGFRADLAELGRRCREAGIRFVVDGIQSLGLMKFDVEEWNIDAVACGGHKCLLGPYGIGFLYCSDRLLGEMRPVYVGMSPALKLERTGEWAIEVDQDDGRRFEFGNLNFPAIFGLHQALCLIRKAKVERIEEHVIHLSGLMDQGLKRLGYRVISPSGPGERSGIVSIKVGDPKAMRDHLAEDEVIASRMSAGFIRFSVAGFNNEEDVDRLLGSASRFKG